MAKLTEQDHDKLKPLIKILMKDGNWPELQNEKDLPEKRLVRFGTSDIHSWYRDGQLVGYLVIHHLGNKVYEVTGDINNIDDFLAKLTA